MPAITSKNFPPDKNLSSGRKKPKYLIFYADIPLGKGCI